MKKKIRGNQLNLFVVLLTMVCLLSGCSGGGSTLYSEVSTQNDISYNAGIDSTIKDSSAESEINENTNSDSNNSVSEENDLSNRKLIKNVSLILETKEFDKTKEGMEQAISNHGGYIENSNFYAPQGSNKYRDYSITARIPANKLDNFVNKAGDLGTLTNKSENVEDVTLSYVDKTAYRDSLKVEYDRVMEILEKATELDQILTLESKLSNLRYEINNYDSQIRTYDNLIAYSTVNIDISEVEQVTETSVSVGSRIKSGFLSSLNTVKTFFVELFIFLVSNLPVLLLWAVIIVLIVFVIKKLDKRQIKKINKRKQVLPPRENLGSFSNQSTGDTVKPEIKE